LGREGSRRARTGRAGTQQYDSEAAVPLPSDVPKSKPVWQTQMSGIEWWPEGGPSSDISNGVAVAGWIHDALVNGGRRLGFGFDIRRGIWTTTKVWC